ncbi:MAG: LysR family transcriptional regulator [Pseudomonadota bacterium]
MEFRHIRYFIAVAEELHFGKAAIRLNISQPPLSKQIQDLENNLGIHLLARNKHKVALTEAGKLFLEQAYIILNEVQQAEKIAQQVRLGTTGILRIGFTVSFLFTEIMHSLIKNYRAIYPNVKIRFYERSSIEQVDSLLNEKLDIGFTRTLFDFSLLHMEAYCLLNEYLMVVLPDNHILCKHETVTISMLANEQFILYERSQRVGLYDQIINLCIAAGFTPDISQEVRTPIAVLGLVAAGLGISIVSSVMQHIQIPNVVYRSLKVNIDDIKVFLIHRKGNGSTLVSNFIKLLPNSLGMVE